MPTTKEQLLELERRRKKIWEMGGASRVEKQHASGKLTARERVGLLFDPGTFQELGLFVTAPDDPDGVTYPSDGVVVGCGAIRGRLTFVAAQDFTVGGGAVGARHAEKIHDVMQEALRCGAPFIQINDSGGARIQEGVDSLHGYGHIFYDNVLLSGVVPQISIIAGPCAGGAAYSPALTDFIIMVSKAAKMFITGPEVVKAVTGQDITAEALGGALVATSLSGVAHFMAQNDEEAVEIAKRLLSFLPQNNTVDPPRVSSGSVLEFTPDLFLDEIIPDDPREPYNVLDVILHLVDDGDFLEIQPQFAPNIVIGLGRIGGRSVGLVANQPNALAGALDINASNKSARFIRFCNAMNIPLVTLVDVPGFLPGIEQEYGGIIRHGAKMLFAYGAATVPKITIILRKAYGGAYLAMCGKAMGADRVFAWPTAEIAVMGADGAVRVLYKKELEQAKDRDAVRTEKTEEYRRQHASPYVAAGKGQVDAVIMPRDTREYLLFALETLHTKRELRPAKKHGTMPL
ncbi:acyl-CoA carboxylase subunit beta [candidate division KSB1 bacterium]|nr:MAG: acyl-CoA carboxylase subunit beta [candidate division KSB1 bacterium]